MPRVHNEKRSGGAVVLNTVDIVDMLEWCLIDRYLDDLDAGPCLCLHPLDAGSGQRVLRRRPGS